MPKRIVIDSGPLIALFDKSDQFHKQAIQFMKSFDGVMITNYAVITEVTHLLDFNTETQIDFLEWVARGALTVVNIEPTDLLRAIEISQIYSDLPADFADASLVAISERLGISKVASIDKDFQIYRFRKRKPFQNVFQLS